MWGLETSQLCENFFGIIVLQFVGHAPGSMGYDFNVIAPLLPSHHDFSLSLNVGCSAASYDFGVLAEEDEHTSFFSAILESLNLTLKVSRIWLQNSQGLRETEALGGHKQNLVCNRIQEEGAETPQETEPDLLVSVWVSPVEAWDDSGPSQGQGHWQKQSWEACVAINPFGGHL